MNELANFTSQIILDMRDLGLTTFFTIQNVGLVSYCV